MNAAAALFAAARPPAPWLPARPWNGMYVLDGFCYAGGVGTYLATPTLQEAA